MTTTTHFTPLLPEQIGRRRLAETPLISVTAVAGVPAIIRDVLGERALQRVNRRTGLDLELIADSNSFIPHALMSAMVEEAARAASLDHFGLTLVPALSITSYGVWGDYLLGAETLGAAIERATASIGLHSNSDRVGMVQQGAKVRMYYLSAAKGQPGYGHVACGAAAVMLSVCRAYLGPRWSPLCVEFDLPKPPGNAPYEESFGCPALFDRPVTALCFGTADLSAPRRLLKFGLATTLEDVARARLARAKAACLPEIVIEQIRLQLYAGAVSIDAVAFALDTSVRTLQRELNRDGVDFRSLANEARWRRGAELLRGTEETVTEIAMALGYSTPAHFSRAFRKQTGRSPEQFRRGPAAA